MMRLILVLLVLAALVMAAQAVLDFARPARRPGGSGAAGAEAGMPPPFRLVAYLLLLALMVGISAGWLGAV
ncbi:hypothetical protein OG2516_06007 [Oceanicola granulosus HTCC2516]|uniref:Uncharacterized protein n=1 Tax=Oceanicola granulosus (strain ATCC BAA-861 / DSM 15982 / KCTC 12143 / HTCC2516) TaxID=314256 RepID=Q2CAZ0_OCEGH|nr:hypothetical protein [Oceanicola granulosus]EAR49835.1 hypothetical protein OG2516_06007 [Oceanicola granulosus HTCC2516]